VNSFFGVVVVSGSTSYSLNKGDTVSWVGLLLRDLKVALSSIVISANAMLNKPLNKRNESPSNILINCFMIALKNIL
jgi:hypothetical protein